MEGQRPPRRRAAPSSFTADAVEALLAARGLDEVVRESRRVALVRDLERLRVYSERETPPEAPRLAQVLERLALTLTADEGRQALFDEAFLCRRAIDPAPLSASQRIAHLACLAADGLAADRRAELVMVLRDQPDSALEVPPDLPWHEELLYRVLRAFVLVARRSSGWGDVRAAQAEIQALREMQAQREPNWAETADVQSLTGVVALYNLARIVDIVTDYTISGSPVDADVRLDRHHANIDELLEEVPDAELAHMSDLLHTGSRALFSGSVWTATRTYGARVREFVSAIASEARETPVLELWPSQRRALRAGLVDAAQRALVVQMPTSAGKTLAAEFAIVQALALNPGSTVCYVVPTRALVNQITLRLRADLGPLDFAVEAAVPVFELDPIEDTFLRNHHADVLVTTPEKLDLLIRSEHPSLAEISLVVADEAHNLGEGERGARLELLLAMIKRERVTARFVLLSPFIPNARELAQWLGDDPDSTVQVDWKPTELITAAATLERHGRGNHLVLHTLPSAHHVALDQEVIIDIGSATGVSRGFGAIAARAAETLTERGSVLILCRGRSYAEQRAREIGEGRTPGDLSGLGAAVAAYAASEFGPDHPLPDLIAKRVCYHHAGLSHDLRFLLERLIDVGEIDVVCGTTTLAQGVNFPIASVVLETLKSQTNRLGQLRDFTFPEFWNIAGRAGRAMRDRVGVVAYAAPQDSDVAVFREYLERDAEALASALVDAVDRIQEAATEFDLQFVRNHRAMSVFTQYLAHALRVTGQEAVRAEVEDLLRSSLVYSQTRTVDPERAEKLIRLARRFLDENAERNPGYLRLADGTGFSLKTVDLLYAKQREQPEFQSGDFWSPNRLFADDLRELTTVIEVLGSVPELHLGRAEDGVFNPRLVAGVVHDWVEGATVAEIADRHFASLEPNVAKRQTKAGVYLHSQLVGQVPWGMGAMQRMALTEDDARDVGYVPSLVFYGVRTKEAAAMRMAGAPRAAAEGLGRLWAQDPNTAELSEAREWLNERSLTDWGNALPSDSPLSAGDARRIWAELSATPTET